MAGKTRQKEYDLLIIGGGPAGLTAAAYGIRKRIETMLISEDLGGKTNYKLTLPDIDTHVVIDGEELVNKFRSQLEYLDFARRLAKVTKFERVGKGFQATTNKGVFKAKAAIIATGVTPQRLKVPGEEKFLGRGVSYSAVSHAPLFIDMDVAVVGEGMQALQAAAELVQIANKVTVIGVPQKLVDSPLGRKVKASRKADFFSDYKVKEIQGRAAIEEIVIGSKTTQRTIRVRGVFVEIGNTPNTNMFTNLVKLDREGRIVVDENNQTSVPGLFAAGDVTNVHENQVVIAVGEGANAALSAFNYLLSVKA